jgi:hypothetical protein
VNLILPIRDACFYALQHPKTKRAVWAGALFLAVDMLLLAALWAPAAYRHHQLEKAIADHREAVLEADRAQATSENYGRLVKRVRNLEAKWETPVTQSGMIEVLTKLASKDRLTVISQDFDSASPKVGKSLEQSISLQGNYQALRRFLVDLENLKTLTLVEQARLERAGEGGNLLRAALKLCTFSRPASGKRL